MKKWTNLLKKNTDIDPSTKPFGVFDLDPKVFIYRILPHLTMELASKYFRLEVEGIENLPRRGPALITPNHSGYSGLDALLLSHEIYKSTGRIPRALAHQFWFLTKATAIPAEKAGFVKASMENGLAQLRKNNLVVIFPEGEKGNFKPTTQRYTLQPFKTGFVRMALTRQCPIVPALILGAEETHINLAQLKLHKYFKNAILPLPLNLIPLPAKWKIVFLPPIELPYKPTALNDLELIDELTQEIQDQIQLAINNELSKRGSIYFK